MTGKFVQCGGLFLAMTAALALGFGTPRAMAADAQDGKASIEQALSTPEGQAALARAGLSADQLKAELAKLTPEQRAELEKQMAEPTAKARLGARMMAAGYSRTEAAERLAMLTDDEAAKLADNPEATTGGTNPILFGLAIAVVALLVALFFVTEPAPEEPEAPAPAPAG